LFNRHIQYQENKQYKKGLKCCEKILVNNPNQAETLALKSLLMNNALKPNFITLAEKALSLDPDNQLVQHVCGIVYKNARNYSKACDLLGKALKNKNTEDNFGIKRELSYCLVQNRDWPKYIENRLELHNRSDATTSVGYANAIIFGHMMNNDYEKAITLFNNDVKLILQKTDNERSEKSQICCSHIFNLIKAKKVKIASQFMEEFESVIMDKEFMIYNKLNIEEEKINVIIKLKMKDKFIAQFKVWFAILIELLDLNPDNRL
jgi:tetratricopeptide (TPR) repeat protein